MKRIDDEPDSVQKERKAMLFDRKLDEVGLALGSRIEDDDIPEGGSPDIQIM
jgi:hypothetical protein